MEMQARQANVIAVMDGGDGEIERLADECVKIKPGTPDLLTPMVYVVPLQLFAYHMSVLRGYNPDQPRNLAKSVTVE
jgi:glucosamine--fructose-6-phosphate aminotransferase (isomerizing)